MSPPDRSDAGNEARPVGGKNEDEHRGKEPERPLDQMPADDALEKPVQALHQPFQKILGAARHLGHLARRHLSKNDQAHRDDPRDDHGVGDRKAERARDLDGLLRQAVFGRCSDRLRLLGHRDRRVRAQPSEEEEEDDRQQPTARASQSALDLPLHHRRHVAQGCIKRATG